MFIVQTDIYTYIYIYIYNLFYMISVFRLKVDENCAFLGHYEASSGNVLPTFRGNISVPFSRVKNLGLLTDRLSRNACKELLILAV
jgi:hypothetical protein